MRDASSLAWRTLLVRPSMRSQTKLRGRSASVLGARPVSSAACTSESTEAAAEGRAAGFVVEYTGLSSSIDATPQWHSKVYTQKSAFPHTE